MERSCSWSSDLLELRERLTKSLAELEVSSNRTRTCGAKRSRELCDLTAALEAARQSASTRVSQGVQADTVHLVDLEEELHVAKKVAAQKGKQLEQVQTLGLGALQEALFTSDQRETVLMAETAERERIQNELRELRAVHALACAELEEALGVIRRANIAQRDQHQSSQLIAGQALEGSIQVQDTSQVSALKTVEEEEDEEEEEEKEEREKATNARVAQDLELLQVEARELRGRVRDLSESNLQLLAELHAVSGSRIGDDTVLENERSAEHCTAVGMLSESEQRAGAAVGAAEQQAEELTVALEESRAAHRAAEAERREASEVLRTMMRLQAEAEAEKDDAAAALREAQCEAGKLKAEIARLEDEVKAARDRENAASDMLAEKNAEIEALRAEHAVRAADRLAKDADAAAERAALMDTEQQLGRAEARVIALESYAKRASEERGAALERAKTAEARAMACVDRERAAETHATEAEAKHGQDAAEAEMLREVVAGKEAALEASVIARREAEVALEASEIARGQAESALNLRSVAYEEDIAALTAAHAAERRAQEAVNEQEQRETRTRAKEEAAAAGALRSALRRTFCALSRKVNGMKASETKRRMFQEWRQQAHSSRGCSALRVSAICDERPQKIEDADRESACRGTSSLEREKGSAAEPSSDGDSQQGLSYAAFRQGTEIPLPCSPGARRARGSPERRRAGILGDISNIAGRLKPFQSMKIGANQKDSMETAAMVELVEENARLHLRGNEVAGKLRAAEEALLMLLNLPQGALG